MKIPLSKILSDFFGLLIILAAGLLAAWCFYMALAGNKIPMQ